MAMGWMNEDPTQGQMRVACCRICLKVFCSHLEGTAVLVGWTSSDLAWRSLSGLVGTMAHHGTDGDQPQRDRRTTTRRARRSIPHPRLWPSPYGQRPHTTQRPWDLPEPVAWKAGTAGSEGGSGVATRRTYPTDPEGATPHNARLPLPGRSPCGFQPGHRVARQPPGALAERMGASA